MLDLGALMERGSGHGEQHSTRYSVERAARALGGWQVAAAARWPAGKGAGLLVPLVECQGRLRRLTASPLLPLDLPADGGGKGVGGCVPDSGVANETRSAITPVQRELAAMTRL